MAKIFVRERRHIGKGAGKPRFAVAAVEGTNLKVYAPHLRKSELESLASACEAEIIYLPRGEKAEDDAETHEGEHGRGRRGRGWSKSGNPPMARPRKRRRLAYTPQTLIYKPAGVPLQQLSRVVLLPEELEALRLADLDGLSQIESAERMAVSRSTFQRILERARRQVALALTQGQALVIEEDPARTAAAGSGAINP